MYHLASQYVAIAPTVVILVSSYHQDGKELQDVLVRNSAQVIPEISLALRNMESLIGAKIALYSQTMTHPHGPNCGGACC